MPIINMFDAETLIVDKLSSIIDSKRIFVEANAEEVNNEYFDEIEIESDQFAFLVLNGGYQADPSVGKPKQQRLKTLWQVVVVCPKSLYMTVGGVKMIEIMNLLKGVRLSPQYDYMRAVSDERGFNRPDYIVDLAYLPMMFSVGTVL